MLQPLLVSDSCLSPLEAMHASSSAWVSHFAVLMIASFPPSGCNSVSLTVTSIEQSSGTTQSPYPHKIFYLSIYFVYIEVFNSVKFYFFTYF